MKHYIDRPDATVKAIVAASFPGYRGRKIALSTDVPKRLSSYWDGGSRDSFAFVELATGKAASVHSNHPFFEKGQPSELEALPAGFVLVMHSICCGKDCGITIYANADQIMPLLPAATSELSADEKRVLYYTRSLKSSYAGISNYRQHESGLSVEVWNAAKDSLISKGLLNKAGAITSSGKNACPDRV